MATINSSKNEIFAQNMVSRKGCVTISVLSMDFLIYWTKNWGFNGCIEFEL